MTECQHGQEPLTAQQMTDLENLHSQMGVVIEYLLASGLELIKDYSSRNLARSARSHLTLQKRLLLDLSTQYRQINSLLSSPRQKEEKGTSTSLAERQRVFIKMRVTCPQCNNGFSFFHGTMSPPTENQAQE